MEEDSTVREGNRTEPKIQQRYINREDDRSRVMRDAREYHRNEAENVDSGLSFWKREKTLNYIKFTIGGALLLGVGYVAYKVIFSKLARLIEITEKNVGDLKSIT